MKQFDSVNSRYGAPMGRREVHDDPDASVVVFKVRMVDGGYDDGGAYWGGGRGVEPLYCARGDDFCAFTRAPSQAAAALKFKGRYPGITITDRSE